MEDLALGTKEYLIVDVTDRLDGLTTLDGHAITYDVKDHAGNYKYQNAAGINQIMKAMCMVDTATWTAGEYELWVKIVIGLETPVLGPFDFNVV